MPHICGEIYIFSPQKSGNGVIYLNGTPFAKSYQVNIVCLPVTFVLSEGVFCHCP